MLSMSPEENFEIAVQAQMYRASNFLVFKDIEDTDYEDWIEKEGVEVEDTDQDDLLKVSIEDEKQGIKKKAHFRFLKKKTLVFQLTSAFFSQLNVCADVQSINGFYKIHFYVKYWFLNNTEMPLKLQLEEAGFRYPEIDLPFISKNFDFMNEFEDDEDDSSPKKKGQYQPHLKATKQEISMIKYLEQTSQEEIIRIRPWEAYKTSQTQNNGLLEALDS